MAMHRSSDDMIALVGQIGLKLPVWQKYGARGGMVTPKLAAQAKKWVKTWRRVIARFETGQFEHSSEELKAVGELAQFLIGLHTEMANQARAAKGMPLEPVPQLTIREDLMVVRERTYG